MLLKSWNVAEVWRVQPKEQIQGLPYSRRWLADANVRIVSDGESEIAILNGFPLDHGLGHHADDLGFVNPENRRSAGTALLHDVYREACGCGTGNGKTLLTTPCLTKGISWFR